MRSRILGTSALCLATFAVHLCAGLRGGDDAYITYVYAANMASGYGFSFNPGDDHVLGTTTPLYAALLAFGGRAGADIPTLSMLIGGVAMSVASAVTLLIAADLGLLTAGALAVIMWNLNPAVWPSVAGMETPWYMALILSALWTAMRGCRCVALLLAACCLLTRIDGAAVLVAVFVYFVARREWSWRASVPAFTLAFAWMALSVLWFGSLVPTSGAAKTLHEAAVSGRFSLISPNLIRFLLPMSWVTEVNGNALAPGWAASVVTLAEGVAFGTILLIRDARARLLLLWTALYVVGYAVLGVPDFPWYYAPPALVGSFIFWVGAQHLLALGSRRLTSKARATSRAVGVLAGIAVASLVFGIGMSRLVASGGALDPHRRAAEWLHEHARPSDTVVAFEVGKLRYFSGLRTVDILGLTEPAARPFLERRDYAWAIREHPEYVFTTEPRNGWPVTDAIFGDPVFTAEYQPVLRITARPDTDHVLFARVSR